MALIKCSECGKQISDQASTCPHCGIAVKAYTYCPYCNAKTASDNFCNNCGHDINPMNNYQVVKGKTNSMALSGGIIGICSLAIDILGLVSITAIVLSSIGLKQVSTTGQKGRGWAIAGIVCGIVELVFKVLMIAYYLNK